MAGFAKANIRLALYEGKNMKKWVYCSLLFCAVFIGTFLLRSAPTPPYPHKLAICAMFKNEAQWLKEWIEYHRVLGATHFYLYNNDSTDDYATVLDPYIQKGIVELIEWGTSDEHAIRGLVDALWCPYQIGAYNDCLKNRALGKAQWVAVIDIDEFIVPVRGRRAFANLLEKEARAGTGTLRLPWRIFGTSHVPSLESGELLTEKLCHRAQNDHPWNGNVKSIHRPEAVELSLIHESKALKEGFSIKRLKGRDYRIHHYWTRTEDFLRDRRNLNPQDAEKVSKEFNEVEDHSIFRYLPLVKQNLAHAS